MSYSRALPFLLPPAAAWGAAPSTRYQTLREQRGLRVKGWGWQWGWDAPKPTLSVERCARVCGMQGLLCHLCWMQEAEHHPCWMQGCRRVGISHCCLSSSLVLLVRCC